MEIKNVVIAGGSIHGVGYIGAIAALEHLKLLKSIKRVCGLSPGGALPALLLSLGYSPEELVAHLVKKDVEGLLDGPRPQESMRASKSERKSRLNCCGGSESPSPTTDPSHSSFDFELTHTLHIHSGSRLHKWLTTIIEKSTLRPNCTFAELHEFVTGKRNVSLLRRGAQFRDLVLVGYNLASNYCFVFSYESTPDAIIADAVRIAVAVPYLFTPWSYYVKEASRAERQVAPGYESIYWMDGGMVQPYPVTIFDSDSSPQATTLGLCLTNLEELVQIPDEPVEEPAESESPADLDTAEAAPTPSKPLPRPRQRPQSQGLNSVWDYSASILQTGFYRQVLEDGDATNRTVFISNCGIMPLRLGITDRDKNRLLECGWNAIMAKFYSSGGSSSEGEVAEGNHDRGDKSNKKRTMPKCTIRL